VAERKRQKQAPKVYQVWWNKSEKEIDMDNITDKMFKEMREEDFMIRVRPFADEDGSWNGEVDISIMYGDDNPMNDEDFHQLLHFTKMMCASVPVMEEVKELRNIVHEYVTKIIDKEMDISVELEEQAGVEKSYDGNVIHLNFNSRKVM
jgi:predicted RNA-binding protein Jag